MSEHQPLNEHQPNKEHPDKKTGYSFTKKVWVTTGIVAFTAVMLLLLESTFNVFLLIFAGILIAVFFRGWTGVIQRLTGWHEKLCVALAIISSLALVVGFFWLIGAQIQKQVVELVDILPRTIESVRDRLEGTPVGDRILDRVASEQSVKDLQGFAGGFFRSTFGVFGDLYVVLFIGIFLTVAPGTYINGFVDLIPAKGQEKTKDIFRELGEQLRNWLKGTLMSMSVVFVFSAVGLAILGVPLWLVLALLAGLLSFIPNFGPILALIPAVLVGFMESPETALWIIGLYMLIQFVESNFITTLIQQRMVNMPPALIISAQMILGALTGSWGLILSTPLTVVVMVLIRKLYMPVKD